MFVFAFIRSKIGAIPIIESVASFSVNAIHRARSRVDEVEGEEAKIATFESKGN